MPAGTNVSGTVNTNAGAFVKLQSTSESPSLYAISCAAAFHINYGPLSVPSTGQPVPANTVVTMFIDPGTTWVRAQSTSVDNVWFTKVGS